ALNSLDLSNNQFTDLTLPAELTNLTELGVARNPLKTVVLSSQVEQTSLTDELASLKNDGITVFAYPLTIRVASAHAQNAGRAAFTVSGPPGTYRVEVTTDLKTWTELKTAANTTGTVEFTDIQ